MTVTIENWLFKTINKRRVEINRTAKRQKYKSQKGITSAKKKIYSCYAKRDLTVILSFEENEFSDTH